MRFSKSKDEIFTFSIIIFVKFQVNMKLKYDYIHTKLEKYFINFKIRDQNGQKSKFKTNLLKLKFQESN